MHKHLSQINGQVCSYSRRKLRGGDNIAPLGIFLLSFLGALKKRTLSPGHGASLVQHRTQAAVCFVIEMCMFAFL